MLTIIKILMAGFSVSALFYYSHLNSQNKTNYSVLAIGNGHYQQSNVFKSYDDINLSANLFLRSFKKVASLKALNSSPGRYLSKVNILGAVREFVHYVEKRKGVGIIYYCGHGLADRSGNMYFIPGDAKADLENTTFESLAKNLLNVDEINKIILEEQSTSSSTRYIIMGDCCSDRVASSMYKGISFHFEDFSTGFLSYDSSFLSNLDNVNSALRATIYARVDSIGNLITPPTDTSKVSINEFEFIPSLIRSMTMAKQGNDIYYSSAMGSTTEMVPAPYKDSVDVGPICRRTILYFKSKSSAKINDDFLKDYLYKLLDASFDKGTLPSHLNRSRN